jgi:hypothetical protein
MNRKTILLAGLCAVLGTAGCQSMANQSRNLSVQAGNQANVQLSLGELQLARGRAYLDAELTTLAIGQFRLAQGDPQTLAAASNGLGVAYARLGRHDLAERYFNDAVTAEPGSERYARNLAMLRDSLPSGTRFAAMQPSPASAAVPSAMTPGLRLTRISKGEVQIGGPAVLVSASPAPKLAVNDEKAVITVIGRRSRPAYAVVVKLDELPGLALAKTEHRPFTTNMLAPQLTRRPTIVLERAPGSRKPAHRPATVQAYPIKVDLTR